MAIETMFHSLLEKSGTFCELFIASPPTSSSSSISSKIVDDLGKLQRMMQRIQVLLKDAEEREIKEERIKRWLADLRDVAYDAEDVIDEVEYELLRPKMAHEEEDHAPTTDDDWGITRRYQASDSDITPLFDPLNDALFQQQIILKIGKINDRFDEIYKQRLALELREEDGQRDRAPFLDDQPRMPSSCIVDEQGVRGREDDKHKVINMLLSGDEDGSYHNESGVRVVSIVGMGGIGKTTLAQLVYDDNKVKSHFEKRAWVCVSDSFEVTRLTKEILEQIVESPIKFEGFNSLQMTLRRELVGKRFLLVLDDLWNDNLGQWEALRVCLLTGALGSRILITTRSEKVSKISQVTELNMYRLGCLSHEDSWALFEQQALRNQRSVDYPHLKAIGQQIVKRCKGLPLALRTLAGLLCNELNEDRWEEILRSELWELREGNEEILPALKLSYHRLHSTIKPCFAYCGAFPKDYEFERDDLVCMWMAQGYIKPTKTRCIEDVGRGYFEDLLQRSFFQEYKKHDYKVFKMHDLIHDLALSIWGGECCVIADGMLPNPESRHISYQGELPTSLTHRPMECMSRWRTLMISDFVNEDVVGNLFQSVKHLRVLALRNCQMKELPNSIGYLKHLRYLRVHYKNNWAGRSLKLPETLGNLLNLQTLQLEKAGRLEELPRDLKDLVNLRHLAFHRHPDQLLMMPRGIGKLTQLQTLSTFVMGDLGSNAAGIEELTGLNHLRGHLAVCAKSLQMWVNANKKEAILRNKPRLESLTVVFGDDDTSPQHQEHLIESLQPHTNIKAIKICNYCGDGFPGWMGNPSYARLKKIFLQKIFLRRSGWSRYLLQALGQLPSVGELKLEDLRDFEGVLTVGADRAHTFPRLRVLTISRCPDLKCVRLRQLTTLRKLVIKNCTQLTILNYFDEVSSQQQRAVRVERVVHIPNVETMLLVVCPRLTQRHLPPSLKTLGVTGSLLLEDWVRSHAEQLAALRCLYMMDETGGVLMVLRNLEHLEEEWCREVCALELRWDAGQQGLFPSSREEAERVLRQILDAPILPRELVIYGYRGWSFPDRVDHYRIFRTLVKMTLSDCVHCERLPPLGRLRTLEELYISRMGAVRRVGREFCRGGFPSLKMLEFDDMPHWEEWEGVEDVGAIPIFPSLDDLVIANCPKFRTGELPSLLQHKLETGHPRLSRCLCPISSPPCRSTPRKLQIFQRPRPPSQV